MESTRLIETVKRAQNGDEEALLALYLDIHQNVYYLALKMMKNPNDAEDMTQEVFITIQEKIAGLHEPAAFYRWINQITANKCTSALRKRRELNGFEEDSDVWVQEENDHMMLPDRAFDDEETRRLIMEVIDNLPVNQRVCVYFYYYEQLTISQIAETLETNENTVKSRLALARGKIKAELERKEREEGIRLYAVPLALTPILRQALQEFTMPEGVTERMWENISRAAKSALPDGHDSNHPDNFGGDTSGQGAPPTNGAGGASAINVTGTAATSAGMTLATKIIIGVVAAAVVTAGVIFLPPLFNSPDDTTTPGVTDAETPGAIESPTPDATNTLTGTENPFDNGTYEGEYDADGKRSGYGVWIYDNFRYEGYFENDMPNGEGALYETSIPPANREPDRTYPSKISVHGNWVNGFSDGTITLNWVMENGEAFTWMLDTANGYPAQDGEAYAADGLTNLYYTTDWLIGGVPPWANVETDSSVSAPLADDTP